MVKICNFGSPTIYEIKDDLPSVIDHSVDIAQRFYAQGKGFHLALVDDGAGNGAGNDTYTLIAKSCPAIQAEKEIKEFDNWSNFGLIYSNNNSTKFELLLPGWHVNKMDSWSNTFDFATNYTKTLSELRNGYGIFNHLNRFFSGRNQSNWSKHKKTVINELINGLSKWNSDKFTLSFNDQKMHFVENPSSELKSMVQTMPDRLPHDHTVYPMFAILTQQDKWHDPDSSVKTERQLLKRLEKLAGVKPQSSSDEYIIGDMLHAIRSIKNHKENAFVATAMHVVGDKKAAEHYMKKTVPDSILTMKSSPYGDY